MFRISAIFLLSFSLLVIADLLVSSSPVQDPELVVDEVHRSINASRRNLGYLSCGTGNPIDDCWRCDPNWERNRQRLADCAIGFGKNAIGGRNGRIYVVTDSSDDNPINPKPGTLRHAVIQDEPLWIIFKRDMVIKLKQELVMNSFKTIDGRGASVHIGNGPCITIHYVSNIIIHGVHIHDCKPSGNADIRNSPEHDGWWDASDGDGVSIFSSKHVWVDHCSLSNCHDGLIDAIHGSTAITISNNYMTHHDKVMLLGHSDAYAPDRDMQVTIAFNHFGEGLVQRMPRCRLGYFHVVNNDYTQWEMYAIGGSAAPTIYSQGNRFFAPNARFTKEVTKGGEPGYAIRNSGFPSPVASAWEGITTLAELFEQSCKQYQHKVLLGTRKLVSKENEVSQDGKSFEKLHLGEYEWLTYARAFEAVCNFASGLVQIGHKKEERVAIFADTREEWFLALQGCFRRNVTVVTIYASLGEEALCHSLNETEVTTVICGSKELKKLVDISGQLDTVKRVICMDLDITSSASSVEQSGRWKIFPFADIEKLGQENPVDADLPVPADVAVIMYTSGSTGLPKGVMMTHTNVLATVSAVMTIVPDLGSKDVYMAYLPLAHILELAAENVLAAVGGSIGYSSPLTLSDTSSKIKKGTKGDATVLRPTVMASVPAILDRVRDGVHKKVDAKGGLSKKLFDLAYARRMSAINGSWFGAWGLEMLLWNFLVFRKVRAVLGGRIRFILSGGAPLSPDTQRFINICLGAPIGQGYGLTETCAGGTFSAVDDTTVGRVGAPLPCSFIKLIDWPEGGYLINDSPMPRGEIVIGGPNVTLGYFKNEEKTKEVYKVDERGTRWFYSGDIGQFHSDGCLEIIDRKKDIVKLQHGEYVSLGKVEAVLIVSPYVDNIMLHADPFHSYCVALVAVSPPAVEAWAANQGIAYSDMAELCEKEETVKEVQASLLKEAKKGRLQKFEIPAKIKLLPNPWTPETGLVTAALKIKREVVRKEFADELLKLYA